MGFYPLSERVMMLQLDTKPVKKNIIQVYAPTADKPDEEVESFYKDVEKLMKMTKNEEITLLMGDFNAKVGGRRVGDTVGAYGLGVRNERGDTLIGFCQEKNLTIANTWYKLPARRLYTWKSPQDTPEVVVRNQIDYITINKRFRNFITRAAMYPGADIHSDHNPVIANTELKLAKRKVASGRKRIDTRSLQTNEAMKNTFSACINGELKEIESSQNIEELWSTLRDTLKSKAEQILGYKKRTKMKKWMTDDILQMMEERRKAKNNPIEYDQIHREIRRKIREAKEKWMMERCEEIEQLQQAGDLRGIHQKVKELADVFKNNNFCQITDDNGKIILEESKVAETWKNYTYSLFDDKRSDIPVALQDLEGPSILRSEVKYAIKIAKNDKASGPDEIYAEYLKLFDDKSIGYLTELFNLIYNTGQIPNDWLKSTFIMIPKTPKATKCKDHRPICLMSHCLKIFLRVLHTRLYRKLEMQSGDTQFGFKGGLGTREAIFSLNMLVQNCYDQRRASSIMRRRLIMSDITT